MQLSVVFECIDFLLAMLDSVSCSLVLYLSVLISYSRLLLTLKVPITTAADNIHCFSEKIRLDVSSESSARQRIHLKNQALFSSKDKSKKLKCHLLQFLLEL